eukprot:410053_1
MPLFRPSPPLIFQRDDTSRAARRTLPRETTAFYPSPAISSTADTTPAIRRIDTRPQSRWGSRASPRPTTHVETEHIIQGWWDRANWKPAHASHNKQVHRVWDLG